MNDKLVHTNQQYGKLELYFIFDNVWDTNHYWKQLESSVILSTIAYIDILCTRTGNEVTTAILAAIINS